MDDYIRPCSNFTCVGQQVITNWVICSGAGMAKTLSKTMIHGIFNCRKVLKVLVKLSEMSFKKYFRW